MAETTAKYPATIATTGTTSPYSDNDWSSATNVGADDGNYASVTAASFDLNDYTYLIQASNFSMGVPTGATITGIGVSIGAYRANGTVAGACVQLANSGTGYYTNKWEAETQDIATSEYEYILGGSTDKWGWPDNELTQANVNASTFGVNVAFTATGDNADIYVDYIRMIAYYSTGITEAGSVSFSVTATAAIGVTEFVATEAGATSFAITATALAGLPRSEAGATSFAVTAAAAIGVTEFVATEQGSTSFAITAAAAIGVTEFEATEAGSASFAITGVCAIELVSPEAIPEAGDTAFAITAAADIAVGYPSELTGLVADTHYYVRAYVTTEAGTAYSSTTREFDTLEGTVSHPESGAGTFAITAAAAIDVTEFVATEAGSTSFAITAAAALSVTEYVATESGSTAFAITAVAAIGVTEFVATESGSAAFALTAVGAADLTAAESGAGTFALTATGAIGVTEFEATESGAAAFALTAAAAANVTEVEAGASSFAITATASIQTAGEQSEAGAVSFSITAAAAIDVTEYVATEAGDTAFAVTATCALGVATPMAGAVAFSVTVGAGAGGLTRSTTGLKLRDEFSEDTSGNYDENIGTLSVSTGSLRTDTNTTKFVHANSSGTLCVTAKFGYMATTNSGMVCLWKNYPINANEDIDGYTCRPMSSGTQVGVGRYVDNSYYQFTTGTHSGCDGLGRVYADGTTITARSGTGGVFTGVASTTDATHSAPYYGGGLLRYTNEDVDWFECRSSHKVTVTGVPTGYWVRVYDGTTAAEAQESGGTAVVDAGAVLFPLSTIQIRTASGGGGTLIYELDTGDYDNMGGGDSYTYAAVSGVALNIIASEPGATSFAITAVGAAGVTEFEATEAGAVAFAITAAADIEVAGQKSEAGDVSFAVTATAAIGVTEYVAEEAGAVAFSITATGAECILANEAGTISFALTAVADIEIPFENLPPTMPVLTRPRSG